MRTAPTTVRMLKTPRTSAHVGDHYAGRRVCSCNSACDTSAYKARKLGGMAA